MNREQLAEWSKDLPERASQAVHRLRGMILKPLIRRALSSNEPPKTTITEARFDQLCRLCKRPPNYPYDHDAVWRRGLKRAVRLIRLNDKKQDARVLELGCGDGMTAQLLSTYGYDVYAVDMEDWRDRRACGIRFYCGKVEDGLPFEDGFFDFIYSYNTFEHLEDPQLALGELVRVCSPGGKIYLDFGPLFCSPWGMHLYRMIPIPYAQFLLSEKFIHSVISNRPVMDLGRALAKPQYLNRWRYNDFVRLFLASRCEVHLLETLWDTKWLWLILRYSQAFSGRSLQFDDVVVTTIRVLLLKPLC